MYALFKVYGKQFELEVGVVQKRGTSPYNRSKSAEKGKKQKIISTIKRYWHKEFLRFFGAFIVMKEMEQMHFSFDYANILKGDQHQNFSKCFSISYTS